MKQQARSQRLSSPSASPREEWEQRGRRLNKLKASQLNTLRVLKSTRPTLDFTRMMSSVDRLRDQLADLRAGRQCYSVSQSPPLPRLKSWRKMP